MAAFFEIWTDRYAPGELGVVSLRGSEQVSKPYVFDLVLRPRGGAPNEAEQDLLGQRAHLRLGGPEGRLVHGVVRRVRSEGALDGREDRARLRVTLCPGLWRLKRTRNSRIFQDLSAPEIVGRILDEAQLPQRWDLAGSCVRRTYCVQHQESDFDFVRRLLAEEGVFFYFVHPDEEHATETVVFCDAAPLLRPIRENPRMRVRDAAAMVEGDGDVRRFRALDRIRPGSATITDFDFRRPAHRLEGSRGMPPDGGRLDTRRLEIYDHHGEHADVAVDDAAAGRHLEQHRTRARTAEGRSRAPLLLPGHWFELAGAALPGHDGKYTVTAVAHEGHQAEIAGPGTELRDLYQNRFDAVPAGVAFRPRRPERRLQQVLETATVVGPAGHEIHTDEHGRIKVQFHWDREGRRNEHSSCWIRTMQPWAGAGWGFQFVPRIGMEVLVMFVGGDVDKPIVVGCAANAEHPPPFPLPRHKTRSGIRTETTRGGNGYNELSFEDRKGAEQVHLRAQRDLDELVLNDHDVEVRHNETTRVAGHQTDLVGGNRIEAVTGNRHQSVGGDATTSVDGHLRVTAGGSVSASVGGHARLDVTGSCAVAISGTQTWAVGRDAGASVSGSASVSVGRDASVVVGGRTSAFLGGDASATFEGSADLRAARTVTLGSDEGLVLSCGTSRIEVRPDGVRVVADKLIFKAREGALVSGAEAELTLDGDLRGVGTGVQLAALGAEILLDTAVTLKGSAIALQSSGGAPASAVQDAAQAPAGPPKLTFRVFVGHGREGRTEGELVVLGKDGGERRRLHASEATRAEHGFYAFELDPEEFDEPVEVVWRTPRGSTHVAGPGRLTSLRDALHGGRLKEARHLKERPKKRTPLVDYTKPKPKAEAPRRPRRGLPPPPGSTAEWTAGVGDRGKARGAPPAPAGAGNARRTNSDPEDTGGGGAG